MIAELLGLNRSAAELSFGHMAARTVVVFVAGVVLLRLGARRSLGRNAGFDILFAVVLGSVLSRAINGQAAFFPSLGASAVLVGLHVLLSFFSSRWHWFSTLIKGRANLLVRGGVVDHRALRQAMMSGEDLNESLRIHGNVADVTAVAEARLERNGEVSVVKKKS